MPEIEELAVEACLRLLEDHELGRLAVDDGEGPLILPVNYVFDRGTVVIRSDLGTKLTAAERRQPAAFEIDGRDGPDVRWSVLVRGRLREIAEEAELDRLRALALAPFVGGHREHFIRLESRSITGRRIDRSALGMATTDLVTTPARRAPTKVM